MKILPDLWTHFWISNISSNFSIEFLMPLSEAPHWVLLTWSWNPILISCCTLGNSVVATTSNIQKINSSKCMPQETYQPIFFQPIFLISELKFKRFPPHKWVCLKVDIFSSFMEINIIIQLWSKLINLVFWSLTVGRTTEQLQEAIFFMQTCFSSGTV